MVPPPPGPMFKPLQYCCFTQTQSWVPIGGWGSQVVNLAKPTPHQQAQDQLRGVRGAKRVHYKYKLCEP